MARVKRLFLMIWIATVAGWLRLSSSSFTICVSKIRWFHSVDSTQNKKLVKWSTRKRKIMFSLIGGGFDSFWYSRLIVSLENQIPNLQRVEIITGPELFLLGHYVICLFPADRSHNFTLATGQRSARCQIPTRSELEHHCDSPAVSTGFALSLALGDHIRLTE